MIDVVGEKTNDTFNYFGSLANEAAKAQELKDKMASALDFQKIKDSFKLGENMKSKLQEMAKIKAKGGI